MGDGITAIHVCGEEVYVERNGKWHLAIGKGQMHCFAELKNWSEDYWRLRIQDPPCSRHIVTPNWRSGA